jgi:hypothetical protein
MSEDIDEIKRNLKSDVVKDRKLGHQFYFYPYTPSIYLTITIKIH